MVLAAGARLGPCEIPLRSDARFVELMRRIGGSLTIRVLA